MATLLRSIPAMALALLLSVNFAYAEAGDSDDMADMMSGDGNGDGYGDGYGDDEDEDGDGDGYGDGDGGGGKPAEEIKTSDEWDSFLNNTDASILGVFAAEKIFDPTSVRPADWDDEEDGEWEAPTIENPNFVQFKIITESVYGYRFAHTSAPELLKKLKLTSGGLYLYRSPHWISKEHGDRTRERFPGDKLTTTAVSHWAETKVQPLVGQYSAETSERYKSAVLIIFVDLRAGFTKPVSDVLTHARKVAAELKGKLAFAVACSDGMSYDMEDYGLDKDKKDSEGYSAIGMGIRSGPEYDSPKYAAPTGKAFLANSDGLLAFANAYIAGELKPYKIPEVTRDEM